MGQILHPYLQISLNGTIIHGTSTQKYFQSVDIDRTSDKCSRLTINLKYAVETFTKGDANKLERILTNGSNPDNIVTIPEGSDYNESDTTAEFYGGQQTNLRVGRPLVVLYGWSANDYIKMTGMFFNYTTQIQDGYITYSIVGVSKVSTYNYVSKDFPKITYKDCAGPGGACGKVSYAVENILNKYFKPLGYVIDVSHNDYAWTEDKFPSIPSAKCSIMEYLLGYSQINSSTPNSGVTDNLQISGGLVAKCLAKKLTYENPPSYKTTYNSVDISGPNGVTNAVKSGKITLNDYMEEVERQQAFNKLLNSSTSPIKTGSTKNIGIPATSEGSKITKVVTTRYTFEGETIQYTNAQIDEQLEKRSEMYNRELSEGFTKEGVPFGLTVDDSGKTPKIIVNEQVTNSNVSYVFEWGNNKSDGIVQSFTVGYCGAMIMSAINSNDNPHVSTNIDIDGSSVIWMGRTSSGEGIGYVESMDQKTAEDTQALANASDYCYTGELTVLGVTDDIKLFTIINIYPLINGSVHLCAGKYVVYGIKDTISNEGKFFTTFKVYRLTNDSSKYSKVSRYETSVSKIPGDLLGTGQKKIREHLTRPQ